MESNLTTFTGKLVRLTALDIEQNAALWAEWSRDSDYLRLLDSDPAIRYNPKQNQAFLENEIGNMFCFAIHRLSDDKVVGMIDLSGFNWTAGDAWVGIGIGEGEDRGKGYGTEAMKLVVDYAFNELNLHRVSLSVFDYNPCAIRSYEKAGFILEGRKREVIRRNGRWYDILYMAVLRREWEQHQNSEPIRV